MNHQDQEVLRLRAENTVLLARVATPQGGNVRRRTDPLTEAMRKTVFTTLKDYVWRTHKFITSPRQELRVANSVLNHMKLPQYIGNTAEVAEARRVWLSVYQDMVVHQLNKVRTYISGRAKEAAFEYMYENEGNLPNTGQLMAIAKRELANENMQRIFNFYVEKMLPRVTGNTTYWNDKKRYFSTVSTCIIEEAGIEQGKCYVPPGTEAFMLVCLEGYGSVWKEQFKLKQEEGPKAAIVTPRASKRSGPLTDAQKEWRCKFTNMDNGQCRYGGWTAEGTKRFGQYLKLVKAARLTPNSSDYEMRAQVAIRLRNDVAETNLEDYHANKKAKRSEYVPPEIEEIEDVWDEDE
jgi:hypothetical protein